MSVLFVDVEQKEREGHLKKEMEESPNFSTITSNGFENKNQSNNNKDSLSKEKEMMNNAGLPKKSSSNDLGALTGEDEGGGDDDGGGEVESELKGGLGSMGSLEESLPMKRGLSSFYSGKSKSFANLAEATTVTDLAKPENSFNKKRRLLNAAKWYSTEDFHSISALNDNDNDDDDDDDEDDDEAQKCNGQNIKRCKTDHNLSSCSHDGQNIKP